MPRSLLLLLLLGLVALTGCGGESQGEPEEVELAPAGEGPVVVAADEPLADVVARVGGQRAVVTAMVPAGERVDDYEPGPADLELLQGADVFFEHGRGRNERMAAMAVQDAGPDLLYVPIGEVINDAELQYGEVVDHGDHQHQYDAIPELMNDVSYVIRYVRSIRNHLARLDPPGAPEYERNAEDLIVELEQLHEAIEESIESIPEATRNIVAFNDKAWAYFARRYDIGISPAHLPADPEDPEPIEFALLLADIDRPGVPAYFGDEPIPESLEEAVRREVGAEYVPELSDSALPGSPGHPEHSYTGMMVGVVRTIVEALGGDPASLDDVELPAASSGDGG